jgi:hypothetical protein
MKSPALPGVISLYVSSRGHISALTAAYEIRQILAADPRQHPTDRPVTPGSAPRTQRRTQANLRYDKRPRKTHPLTPTKQAAGSPRSGRVIRYGLRDGRRRGIDATKLRFHSRCARQSTRYKGFIHWILAIPTILLAGKVAMNGVLQMRCWKAQAPGAFMRMQVGDLEF